MKRATLDDVLHAADTKTPSVLATNLESGEQHLFAAGQGRTDEERVFVKRVLRRGAPTTTGSPDSPRWFYEPLQPPKRLILVGAVHIARSLSMMAKLTGQEVTIVDPRVAFATAERFPDVALILAWPAEALHSLDLDAQCAVVTLSHNSKLDDEALEVALKSSAFYIGCLGSRRTHAVRLARLRERGFSEAELGRLHGPVGLPIGSRSPGEIAVSILAHITQVQR